MCVLQHGKGAVSSQVLPLHKVDSFSLVEGAGGTKSFEVV